MLRGIAFILITLSLLISLLNNELGLGRLKYLYDEFLSIASLVVIVVFQPELRRALMPSGRDAIIPWTQQ